jgi:glycosyltransferase involved in cell wall biosynthesis
MKSRGHEVGVLCYEHSTSNGVPRRGVIRDEFGGLPVTRFCYDSRKWKDPALYEYYNPEFGDLSRTFFAEEGPDVIHFTHNSLLSAALIDSAVQLKMPTVLTLTDFWYICPRMQLVSADHQCDGPSGDEKCLDCFYLAGGSSVLGSVARLLPGALRKRVDALRDSARRKAVLKVYGKTIRERPEFLRKKMGLINVVIAPTVFLRDTFARFGYEKETFRIIPFGINTDLIRGIAKTESSKLRIGFIGTLREHKGPHVLLEAAMKVKRDDVEFLIYGSESEFPEYAQQLKALAAGDKRVKFAGTFPREEIGKVLAGIDALVMPSLWHENSPLMLLYSLASHTPVIASNAGGLSEFITDDVNGLLFEKGDSAALAGLIEKLADDRSFLRKLASAPVSIKSIQAHADEIEGIYRELAPRA